MPKRSLSHGATLAYADPSSSGRRLLNCMNSDCTSGASTSASANTSTNITAMTSSVPTVRGTPRRRPQFTAGLPR